MYAQKKPIENVHIVRERDRERLRELLALLSLGIPIAAFLLLFTWQNLEVIRLGRDATRLQKTSTELREQNRRLRVEIERLTALEKVEAQARSLGFEHTDSRSIAVVRTSPAAGER
jgi:cell division protein FtsB